MVFFLPAVPWILGALFATGAAVAVRELFFSEKLSAELSDKTDKKILAIVGDSMSGKTTFTRFLAQGIVGDSDYSRTVADTAYGGSMITLSNGTKLHIGDMKDVPGEPSAWLSWKHRVQESHHVLYLLRSHSLRDDQVRASRRCRRDLQQVRSWLEEMDPQARPPVLLVFSFRDKDHAGSADLSTTPYADELIEGAGLRASVVAISRLTTVRFASGSLLSQESAEELLLQVAEHL